MDPENQNAVQVSGKRVKAKARLVILGYLDPELENLHRDSPTLGRNSKNDPPPNDCIYGLDVEVVRYSSSISTGKTPTNRILAVEPVPELIQALRLKTNEVCKLEKGAYGLVDAPYMWFMAITEEL